MKPHSKNRWIIQDNAEQQQQEKPEESKVNFLGPAVTELGMPSEIEDKEQEEEDQEEEEEDKDKEKKKQETAKEENRDFPKFSREKKQETKENKEESEKKKPTKDESVEILRAQRDEFKTKYDTIQVEVSKLGDGVELTAIAPVVDYIREQLGDQLVTKENISKIVDSIKSKDQQIETLQKDTNETKGKLREISIDFDDDFRRDYIVPFKTAEQSLFLEYAQPDADGNIMGPNSVTKLNALLFGTEKEPIDPAKLSAQQVKGYLTQYSKDFKEETGMDLPSISLSTIMGSIQGYVKTRNSLREARMDWDNKKKESQTKAQAEAQQQKELAERKNKDTRRQVVQKAYDNFDESPYEGIFTSEEIGDAFSEEYKYSESMFSGKPPGWDELAIRGFKARTHDMLMERFKEKLQEKDELIESLKKKIGGELRGGGGGKKPLSGDRVNFLGEAQSVLNP